jgi:hypothetical protein
MVVAKGPEIIVTLPAIGHDGAAGLYGCLHEGLKCRLPPIRHSGETETAGVGFSLTFAVWLCEHSNLDSGCNQHLVSNTASFASCSPVNKALVNLNMTVRPDPFPLGPDHRRPELV